MFAYINGGSEKFVSEKNGRASMRSSRLLLLVALLATGTPLAFSQQLENLKEPLDDQAWAMEMERRVWAALGAVDLSGKSVAGIHEIRPAGQIVREFAAALG